MARNTWKTTTIVAAAALLVLAVPGADAVDRRRRDSRVPHRVVSP